MINGTVQRNMFTVLHGQPTPVVTRWTYSASDPFALTLAVRARQDRWVEWLLARDLVVDGLTRRVGEGDVRLRPRLVQGYDIVEIEICSHDGRAVLEIDRDLLREFVDLTFDVVAPGEEADHMNIEEEIARITRSCAE